jgi:hypothetical protein
MVWIVGMADRPHGTHQRLPSELIASFFPPLNISNVLAVEFDHTGDSDDEGEEEEEEEEEVTEEERSHCLGRILMSRARREAGARRLHFL